MNSEVSLQLAKPMIFKHFLLYNSYDYAILLCLIMKFRGGAGNFWGWEREKQKRPGLGEEQLNNSALSWRWHPAITVQNCNPALIPAAVVTRSERSNGGLTLFFTQPQTSGLGSLKDSDEIFQLQLCLSQQWRAAGR